LKFERGRDHVRSLLTEALAFLHTEPYRVEAFDRDEQRVFILRARANPPERLALIMGDGVHNLRSALDLAACELVSRNGGTVTENTAFPPLK